MIDKNRRRNISRTTPSHFDLLFSTNIGFDCIGCSGLAAGSILVSLR